MAAGTAALNGCEVVLVERNERPARKVMITGKGRCNVTNNCNLLNDLIANVPTNGRFLYSAFTRFMPSDTMDFFESRGVELKVERGNRVFPVSDKAVDIVDALNDYAQNSGAKRIHGRASELLIEDGKIVGVQLENEDKLYAEIIFDDFGNITRMRGETIESMRQGGMEVCVFNPVHQYVNRLYFNYRDHRKILSIDGQYAYTGGVNIADEYTGRLIRFGEWKDGGVLLDGPGAWGLTSQFIHMWEMLGGRVHREHDYYRPLEERQAAKGLCQPFSDGPINNPDNPAEDMYFQCIANAHQYLWVTSPYFAVEDSMAHALCTAAGSGVDVRLMLPGIPDHTYTQIVAGSYYENLLRHGVKIYEFTPGFLHTKSLVADGEIALLGTINMDYRSFQLHYECGAAFYGAPVIADVVEDMKGIMERSVMVDAGKWEKRSWFKKLQEKVLKIFSIWM